MHLSLLRPVWLLLRACPSPLALVVVSFLAPASASAAATAAAATAAVAAVAAVAAAAPTAAAFKAAAAASAAVTASSASAADLSAFCPYSHRCQTHYIWVYPRQTQSSHDSLQPMHL